MIIKDNCFLIDSNSIITPYKTYYPFDFAEKFWNQIKNKVESGEVVIIDVVKDELVRGDDDLSDWIKEIENALIESRSDPQVIQKYAEILNYIQTSDLYKEAALREWADAKIADAWLIAFAAVNGCKVVTFEKENKGLNSKQPTKNAKIPDICNEFGVGYVDLFQMMRTLGIGF